MSDDFPRNLVPTDTRTIGNDENDVYCDICERKGWFTAVEMFFAGGSRKIICQDRYEGESCTDVLLAHVLAKGV